MHTSSYDTAGTSVSFERSKFVLVTSPQCYLHQVFEKTQSSAVGQLYCILDIVPEGGRPKQAFFHMPLLGYGNMIHFFYMLCWI
jgi:hypothetical protein